MAEIKTNSALAAFFNTGDQPSETEFGHLIDAIHPPMVALALDANTTITRAEHAFRPLIMGNMAASRTMTLPAPELDVWYHFIHLPLAAESGHDLIFRAEDEANFFEGGVVSLDIDNTGATSSVIFGDGGTHDKFRIVDGSFADIWLYGKSSTVYYIWGHSAQATNIIIEDA